MKEHYRPDIVISDRSGGPIVIVEIRSRSSRDDGALLSRLRSYITALGNSRVYGILVDPDFIRIVSSEQRDDGDQVTIPSADVLRSYDPEYPSQIVYESYFTSLVESWLNDLSIHWQSEHPPGEDRLPKDLISRLRAA